MHNVLLPFYISIYFYIILLSLPFITPSLVFLSAVALPPAVQVKCVILFHSV